MEPTSVAEMISAGSKIAGFLFDKWSGQKAESDVSAYVSEHYDTIRGLVSDNCMRLLKRLEDGQNRSAQELLPTVYSNFRDFEYEEIERLRSEFDYRLFFLALAGLITRPTREFYITTVGAEFVRQARERKDYFKALFD